MSDRDLQRAISILISYTESIINGKLLHTLSNNLPKSLGNNHLPGIGVRKYQHTVEDGIIKLNASTHELS